jgi:hypothetical protein
VGADAEAHRCPECGHAYGRAVFLGPCPMDCDCHYESGRD